MADGAAIPASKKRGRKQVDGGEGDAAAATPKKRGGGRKPKVVAPATPPGVNGDDVEENPRKKVKVEPNEHDEEDYGVNGNIESQESS